MTMKVDKLAKEFGEFMSVAEVAPPIALREAVLTHVSEALNPSSHQVFFKMLGVHTVVSLFSLSICSQFGIRFLQIYDAMDVMMSVVGHTYCMAFCGLLYFSMSALALSLLLKPEEIKVVRRHKELQMTVLVGVSLGVFLCLGAEVLFIPGALWLAGSLAGGIASFEFGWMMRSKLKGLLGA